MKATAALVLAATTAAAVALTACGGSSTTDEVAYTIDQPFRTLVIGARAAAVEITTGAGPATVKEVLKYAKDKPRTSHRLDSETLRLTDEGCVDDESRCTVEYHIRVPAATSAEVTAEAGAVQIAGLAGSLHVTTEAGAIEATGLSGDEVVVRTEAGAASLEFTEAPATVRAQTQLGAVKVRVPGDSAYAVAVSADVGKADVQVRQDPASAHRIDVSTQLGAVSIQSLS